MNLIDRDKLLDTFQYHCGEKDCDSCGIVKKEHCDTYMTIMEQEVVNQWVPCSEKLPGEYEVVLVYLQGGIFDIAVYCNEYGFRPWYSAFFEECTPEWEEPLLAWMKLPEPYKGELSWQNEK